MFITHLQVRGNLGLLKKTQMYTPEFMTDHLLCDCPERPQSYWEHGRFAMQHSIMLIVAGLAGVIHAVFPWWFKFYTAEEVVKAFKAIESSGRHEKLLREYGYR